MDLKKPKIKGKKKDRQPVMTIEDEIEAAIQKSSVHETKVARKKSLKKYGIYAAIVCFLGWVVYFLFVPHKGPMVFGLCRVFLERSVTYPHTLVLSAVEELNDFIRIWYMQTNAFGEVRMEPIQCHYVQDETGSITFTKVSIRRRAVDQKTVQEFNKVIPIIMTYPPDLTLPWPLPDKLENLHYEVNTYMRPIFKQGSQK